MSREQHLERALDMLIEKCDRLEEAIRGEDNVGIEDATRSMIYYRERGRETLIGAPCNCVAYNFPHMRDAKCNALARNSDD